MTNPDDDDDDDDDDLISVTPSAACEQLDGLRASESERQTRWS